ncbi:PaaI family thioesterase [Paracoccus sanguinis]|uniref:PaaI family thioesterase n=1 Tax=Paracoccus sanguinis TaxID=1545044 RepID=UPI00051FCE73|nr:PaaI family thioesterase [Paracoccus sanguinis]KGJ20107.1 phenylacetic acid degradation protein [Paracoccus sanguinis]
MDAIEARLRASFARQTMMTTLGAEMARATAGEVVIAAPIAPHLMQQQGAAHAGLAFSIGDSAAGYAALSVLPEGSEVVTVEMKINLLAPAVGARLVAEGRVVKAGRRIVVVAADVWAEGPAGRKQVATMLGTMVPVEA